MCRMRARPFEPCGARTTAAPHVAFLVTILRNLTRNTSRSLASTFNDLLSARTSTRNSRNAKIHGSESINSNRFLDTGKNVVSLIEVK